MKCLVCLSYFFANLDNTKLSTLPTLCVTRKLDCAERKVKLTSICGVMSTSNEITVAVGFCLDELVLKYPPLRFHTFRFEIFKNFLMVLFSSFCFQAMLCPTKGMCTGLWYVSAWHYSLSQSLRTSVSKCVLFFTIVIRCRKVWTKLHGLFTQ